MVKSRLLGRKNLVKWINGSYHKNAPDLSGSDATIIHEVYCHHIAGRCASARTESWVVKVPLAIGSRSEFAEVKTGKPIMLSSYLLHQWDRPLSEHLWALPSCQSLHELCKVAKRWARKRVPNHVTFIHVLQCILTKCVST